MKKKEALPLIKDWSQFYVNSIEKILNHPMVEAEISFNSGKVIGDNTPYCAFSFRISEDIDLGITPSCGVTKVPYCHSTLFANQILEDIVLAFMENDMVDFSHFCSKRGMLPPSFHGFYMGENKPRISINFESFFPDQEHINSFEDALAQKEEKKNGLKR